MPFYSLQNKKMNILHVSTTKSWRGGEQQIAYLAKELSQKKLNQRILCPMGSKLASHCEAHNIKYITFNKKSSFSLSTARHIQSVCKEKRIDLIHVHDSHAHTFAVLAASLFGNKSPIIVSRRVDFPIGGNIFSKWKYNHPSVKKILTVSRFIKQLIKAKIKDQSKIQVVYDGVDEKRFPFKKSNILHHEYGISDDIKLIGNVAALAPHKDYYTFVKTVEEFFKISKKEVKFLIIGADDGEQDGIEQFIKNRKLTDKIIVTGFRNDIPKILPELDIFLFTSKEEGLGTSILDAFICGVPVVATRAGGVPEIVIHNDTGLTAEIENAKQLAEHIKSVLSNKTIAKKLIINAKRLVNSFSIETMAEKTYAIYIDVVKKDYL